MTAPRLTLPSAGLRPVSDLRVTPLSRMAHGGRWRTEAMRSYSSPLLLWFTKGQGRITASGVTRGFGPHNAIFLPPHTMHGFEMVGNVLGTAVYLPRGGDLVWPDEVLHLRLRDARRQSELTAMIETLEREAAAEDEAADRALYHHAGLLSVTLERYATAPDPSVSIRRKSASDRLASAFTALVERDYATSKPISAYAADLGVTPTHLTRACKQASGRGALEIVGDRKLYEARRRLVETETPVGQIASDLGFASAAYFTRAFRQQTGVTPSAFRKRG